MITRRLRSLRLLDRTPSAHWAHFTFFSEVTETMAKLSIPLLLLFAPFVFSLDCFSSLNFPGTKAQLNQSECLWRLFSQDFPQTPVPATQFRAETTKRGLLTSSSTLLTSGSTLFKHWLTLSSLTILQRMSFKRKQNLSKIKLDHFVIITVCQDKYQHPKPWVKPSVGENCPWSPQLWWHIPPLLDYIQ